MGETCQWCGGIGSCTPEANFLLARLRDRDDYRWIGLSSDAMVVAAITGEEPTERPYDAWDLGRCMVTRAVAPASLHEAMDRMIEHWRRLLFEGDENRYYKFEDAEKMVEKELPVVQSRLAEWSA